MIGQELVLLNLERTFMRSIWLFCRITPCYLVRGSKAWKVGLSGTVSMVTDAVESTASCTASTASLNSVSFLT